MRTGAPYSTWFNGGIRTTLVLPQPDRHPHRDDRQPDAGRDSVRARHAAAARRRAESDPAADLLLPRSDRVLGDQQLRDSRHRVEAARRLPLQHVQDGEERHREGQPRQLDDPSEADRSGARGDRSRAGPPGRVARTSARAPRSAGVAAAAAAAARRSRSTTTSCTIRRCAIRAASSCRRISRTSSPRPSSSTP